MVFMKRLIAMGSHLVKSSDIIIFIENLQSDYIRIYKMIEGNRSSLKDKKRRYKLVSRQR